LKEDGIGRGHLFLSCGRKGPRRYPQEEKGTIKKMAFFPSKLRGTKAAARGRSRNVDTKKVVDEGGKHPKGVGRRSYVPYFASYWVGYH